MVALSIVCLLRNWLVYNQPAKITAAATWVAISDGTSGQREHTPPRNNNNDDQSANKIREKFVVCKHGTFSRLRPFLTGRENQ